MTAEQWMRNNLPKGKTTLSVDAVEILIKLAWEEATESERQRALKDGWKPPTEVIGPYDIP